MELSPGFLGPPGRLLNLSEITNHGEDELRALFFEAQDRRRTDGVVQEDEKVKDLKLEAQLSGDISGTTSAKSRKMTPEEYEVMLYKRKLRNRQSASKSRKRHQTIVKDLQEEVEQLGQRCETIMKACEELATINSSLRNENMQLHCEGVFLKAQLSLLGP